MKNQVCDIKEFDREFPELYNWEGINESKLGCVAETLAAQINTECLLPESERHRVSGMRQALRIIAEYATI